MRLAGEHMSVKNRCKNRCGIEVHVLIDFFEILNRCWRHFGHRRVAMAPQSGPDGAQKATKGAQRSPKGSPCRCFFANFWGKTHERRPGGPHDTKMAPKSSPNRCKKVPYFALTTRKNGCRKGANMKNETCLGPVQRPINNENQTVFWQDRSSFLHMNIHLFCELLASAWPYHICLAACPTRTLKQI